MARIFFRCVGCCAVMAFDGALPPGATCGMCDGALDFMGKVRGTRLVDTAMVVPCDARCTNARGPNCDCSCAGENHGSGMLVEVIVSETGIPKVTPTDPATVAKAKANAAAFLAAKDAARARLLALHGDIIARKNGGEWLNATEFDAFLTAKRAFEALGKAKKLKTHAGRMKALANIGAPAPGGTP